MKFNNIPDKVLESMQEQVYVRDPAIPGTIFEPMNTGFFEIVFVNFFLSRVSF
mgnify:CR=1 FL=1